MEINNNSINIEDVDMMEIDKVEFINRIYCTLESKVKALDIWKKIKSTLIKHLVCLKIKGKKTKYEEIEEKLLEYITININAKKSINNLECCIILW